MKNFTDEGQTFTVAEAALKMRVSEKTIRRYIDAGLLGCYPSRLAKDKRRGKILIGQSHIDAFHRKCKHFLSTDWSSLSEDDQATEWIRLAQLAGLDKND